MVVVDTVYVFNQCVFIFIYFIFCLWLFTVLVSNSDARKKKKRKHPSTPLPADGSSAAQMRHLMSSLLRRHPRAAEPEPEHPYVMPGEHASKQLVDRSMDELFGDRTLGEGRHDPGGYFRRPLVVLSLRNRNSPDLRSAVRWDDTRNLCSYIAGFLLYTSFAFQLL
jgi:hypothetical protein